MKICTNRFDHIIFLLCTFCTFCTFSLSKVQIVQIVQCHFFERSVRKLNVSDS